MNKIFENLSIADLFAIKNYCGTGFSISYEKLYYAVCDEISRRLYLLEKQFSDK